MQRNDAMTPTTHALSKHVPDMEHGFTIHTNYGDLEIHQDEVAPFIDTLTRCLIKRLEKERKDEPQ